MDLLVDGANETKRDYCGRDFLVEDCETSGKVDAGVGANWGVGAEAAEVDSGAECDVGRCILGVELDLSMVNW